jgi:hypothetical protein
MKTKLRAVVIAALLLAATVSAGKFFVSAAGGGVALRADQLPVPGIDISVEKSADGTVVVSRQTDNNGNFPLVNTKPGTYVITCTKSVDIKVGKKNVPFLVTINSNGEAIATGTWADTTVPFKMDLKVEGSEPQTFIGKVLTAK